MCSCNSTVIKLHVATVVAVSHDIFPLYNFSGLILLLFLYWHQVLNAELAFGTRHGIRTLRGRGNYDELELYFILSLCYD